MPASATALVVVIHHALADERGIDAGADGGNHAARLVAGDDRAAGAEAEGGRGVARRSIRMQVAAAHPGGFHLEDDFAGAGRGVGELLDLELAIAEEDDAAHGSLLGGSTLSRSACTLTA